MDVMKKVLKWIGIIFVILVAIPVIIGIINGGKKHKHPGKAIERKVSKQTEKKKQHNNYSKIPRQYKIKGFYLGMKKDDAIKLAKKLFVSEKDDVWQVKFKEGFDYGFKLNNFSVDLVSELANNPVHLMYFLFDKGVVSAFYIYNDGLDRLFNRNFISEGGDDFMREFIAHYFPDCDFTEKTKVYYYDGMKIENKSFTYADENIKIDISTPNGVIIEKVFPKEQPPKVNWD